MQSILAYVGGKSLLANKIIPLIPPHHCYCEVFAGAAWLLFKKERSKVEIINDINLDLVTLYRVIQNHLDEFIRYFRWILVSREEFERFKVANPEILTDIQRAVRFYYLLKCGYGAKIKSPVFSISTTAHPRLNLLRIEEELSEGHLRLSQVYIENKGYQYILERFDKEDTFFYLDPPYYGFENYYGDGIFDRADFAELAGILHTLKGRFILSINDTPEIREIFKGFAVEKVTTRYGLQSGTKKKEITELLISNYTQTR